MPADGQAGANACITFLMGDPSALGARRYDADVPFAATAEN